MVRVCGLRNESLEFESQRPLDVSSLTPPSLHLANLPKGDLRLPLKTFVESDLMKIALFTFEAAARMHVPKAKATEAIEGSAKEATQGGSSSTRSEEAMVNKSYYDLELSTSRVT